MLALTYTLLRPPLTLLLDLIEIAAKGKLSEVLKQIENECSSRTIYGDPNERPYRRQLSPSPASSIYHSRSSSFNIINHSI